MNKEEKLSIARLTLEYIDWYRFNKHGRNAQDLRFGQYIMNTYQLPENFFGKYEIYYEKFFGKYGIYYAESAAYAFDTLMEALLENYESKRYG